MNHEMQEKNSLLHLIRKKCAEYDIGPTKLDAMARLPAGKGSKLLNGKADGKDVQMMSMDSLYRILKALNLLNERDKAPPITPGMEKPYEKYKFIKTSAAISMDMADNDIDELGVIKVVMKHLEGRMIELEILEHKNRKKNAVIPFPNR